MCLLITGSSNKIRNQLLNTNLLIENIYGKNSDGLGIMFGGDGGLTIQKALPATAQDARTMIEALPDDDRDLAMHWRWRTHGDIDFDNCHPYDVSTTTAMMHNGILSTGNDDDPSKSDTWHFVKNYLAGVPDDVLHMSGFREMLGDFIGGNKFAIMSADGRLSVINKDQGIMHDGVWYSNTYAWSPALLIPRYFKKGKKFGIYGNYGGWSGHLGANASAYGLWDEEDGAGALMVGNAGAGAGGAKESAKVFALGATGKKGAAGVEPGEEGVVDEISDVLVENIEECLYQFDSSTLALLMEDEFDQVTKYILDNYLVTQYIRFRPEDYSIAYAAAVQAWVGANMDALRNIDPGIVAETLIQCCDFVHVNDAVEEAVTPADSTPSLSLVQ